MYLSDNELKAALEDGSLIFEPKPQRIDPTSIDVHLGGIESVAVWDIHKLAKECSDQGRPENDVYLGTFNSQRFSAKYQCPPPEYDAKSPALVMRHGNEIVVRPGGFLLWITREVIGTPPEKPRFICFIDGKSTRARTGIVVHLTAPTIHAGWAGHVVLEIKNLGELTFRLRPGDVIAAITVACVTSTPSMTHMAAGSVTFGQQDATGRRDPAQDD